MVGMSKEQQVEAFNIEHPVGSPVTVRLDGGGVLDTTVRYPAQLLGGHTPVVWLKGVSGCYALTHVFGYCHGKRATNAND
jgi:hypothetical protein